MKTEIYGTFGPACAEKNILRDMIDAGMTGMRLNLSHTTLLDSKDYIVPYQDAAAEAGVHPQILIDMQGSELRVGELQQPLELKIGDRICLYALVQEKVDIQAVPVPEAVIRAVEPEDEILLDDGKVLLKVQTISAAGEGETANYTLRDTENVSFIDDKICAYAKVLRGGVLHGLKSIKIVDKNVDMPPLTIHDIENIKLANGYGITALMQPFVLSGKDLRYVRDTLKENNAEHIKIFAKIENRTGVQNLEDILPEADVIIIARGDLGNDMPLWELPRVQKQIETACKKAGKPYIVVTQMLASMEQNPVPTRAEVSDIFHAVYHGAWGVMVTGETAIGKYPIEVIRYLANTAWEAENG